jgi:hypothetical protein
MLELRVPVYNIVIASTSLDPFQYIRCFQFSDQSQYRALCDIDLICDIP